MRRLLTLTTVPLERDPRARRAALAAEELGWKVDAVSSSNGASGPVPEPRSWSPALRELLGLYRIARLALRTARLVRAGRDRAADIVHVHDFDNLPAGYLLSRRREARLVYDAHELYTGFERHPPRAWALFLRVVEGALARRADAVVTVSDGIAAELARLYRLPSPPIVVLNCPPLEPAAVEPRQGDARAVYQAAAGPGRTLADLAPVAAAGVDVSARVLGANGLPPGVHALETVEPDELVQALAPFDVGLVIDRAETRNAELALPNKLFEYLMAGLAVVVPSSAEMAGLVERERVGVTFPPGGLAEATAALCRDRTLVEELRTRARALAESRYNAEAQRPALHRAWGL